MSDSDIDKILFAPLAPHRTGMLAVDAVHTLYWEESGNPHGTPVLFLHGGPGSGAFSIRRITASCCLTSAVPANRRRWANTATTPRNC